MYEGEWLRNINTDVALRIGSRENSLGTMDINKMFEL